MITEIFFQLVYNWFFFFSSNWNFFSVLMDISKNQWRSTGGISKWPYILKLRSFCWNACLLTSCSSTIRKGWALPLLEPSHKSVPKCDNDQSVPFQLHKYQSTSASPNNSLHTNQATYSIYIVLEWIFALWYPSNFDQKLYQ